MVAICSPDLVDTMGPVLPHNPSDALAAPLTGRETLHLEGSPSMSLLQKGFCVIPGAAIQSEMDQVERCAHRLVQEHQPNQKDLISLGTLIDVRLSRELIEFGLRDKFLLALEGLGLSSPTFSDGTIFSKPGSSGPTFWHQDFPNWNDPSTAFAPETSHFMVLWYLTDTSPANGCLRGIPGSHLTRHELHDLWPKDDTGRLELRKKLRASELPDHPLASSHDDETAIPVKRGDAVVMDSRLLHGAYANSSELPRTAVTFWYYSNPQILVPKLRQRISNDSMHALQTFPNLSGYESRMYRISSDEAMQSIEPLPADYIPKAPPHTTNLL